MADGAHFARRGRACIGVAFGTGRVRFFARFAEFVAGIGGGDFDVVLILAQLVLHGGAVAIRAIQLNGQRFVQQAFDSARVGFVREFGVFRGRSRAAPLRLCVKRHVTNAQGQDNGKYQKAFHLRLDWIRLIRFMPGHSVAEWPGTYGIFGCRGNLTYGKRAPRTIT